MKDVFGREIVNGDIIVRIYDWGAWDAMLIVGSTPSGMLRTVGLKVLTRTTFEFTKNTGLVKSAKNAMIMTEELLRSHIAETQDLYRFYDETIDDLIPCDIDAVVEAFLEEQRKIKELN